MIGHVGRFTEVKNHEFLIDVFAEVSKREPGAKLLLVCLGAPKQEKWIASHKAELKVNLCMGVGGTLDVLAGAAKRAPEIFIKLNLEWAYRILKNPSRI
ncbi:MAG: WecB/TagA/CpsF family glycosyltransferase, partial [Clostridia bacterium]|nr:WecB/TagA/CpsF family glycosyltransferase [Clostridia bacterium]